MHVNPQWVDYKTHMKENCIEPFNEEANWFLYKIYYAPYLTSYRAAMNHHVIHLPADLNMLLIK